MASQCRAGRILTRNGPRWFVDDAFGSGTVRTGGFRKHSPASPTRCFPTATVRAMLTPGKNKWGLGVETGGTVGHPYFTHGGANEGFQCDLVAYNNGDGAVIMTNSDSGGQLATEILRTIAHEYAWPDFQPVENTLSKVDDPKTLARYMGVYRMASGANMVVTLDGSHLLTRLGEPADSSHFSGIWRRYFLRR